MRSSAPNIPSSTMRSYWARVRPRCGSSSSSGGTMPPILLCGELAEAGVQLAGLGPLHRRVLVAALALGDVAEEEVGLEEPLVELQRPLQLFLRGVELAGLEVRLAQLVVVHRVAGLVLHRQREGVDRLLVLLLVGVDLAELERRLMVRRVER